jgi:hypothetical protein
MLSFLFPPRGAAHNSCQIKTTLRRCAVVRCCLHFGMDEIQMNKTSDRHRNGGKFFARVFYCLGFLCLALLALALTGCSFLRLHSSPPKAQVNSIQLTNLTTGPVTFPVLQAQVMRFADTYAATVAQACDEISAQTTNSDVRLMALRWKLGQAASAYTDAAGQNPAVNALDMLVLVSMARMVVEGYGAETYGDAIHPLLDAQRNLETNAWTMAGGLLRPSQQQELRDLIKEWRQKNPHQHYVGQIRFREFVTALGRMPSQTATAPTSLFSLLYLDPLAGLDPTAAAIEETRELGERAMYYTQRMPTLLSWQTEVLAYQLANQPAPKQMLDDANRLAASSEIFAKTAQQLPGLISDQRQALDSASEAATNINAAIKSLTEFVQYVSPTNPAPASITNSNPFNVLDYGTAAAQIGAAANNLNALLASVNQSAPQLEKLSRQTTAEADRVVQHAFRMGIVLIIILLAGSVLAGLAYRVLANKLTKNEREP